MPLKPPASVLGFAAAFVAIELLLQLSDAGVLPRDLRFQTYRTFAFWDVYFNAALSGQEVGGQLWWSFVTHAFLHGGMIHLAMNTAVFLALASHLNRAVGEGATLALFFGCAVGGALAFGVIADTGRDFVPMVGASGAIFGYLGAMKRWEWRYVVEHHLPRRRFASTMTALVAINVVLSLGVMGGGGGVAWEAHLGGFAAGWLLGGAIRPRRGYAIGPI